MKKLHLRTFKHIEDDTIFFLGRINMIGLDTYIGKGNLDSMGTTLFCKVYLGWGMSVVLWKVLVLLFVL